jgi:hypothetical protein
MNIDEEIKQDLLAQSKELDDLLAENNSLSGYLNLGLSSGLGWLVKLGYILAIFLSILLIFCGYQFFVSTAENEVFWGVCLIMSLQAQIATKLWIFMQSNRSYISRELRLMEYRRRREV